MPTSIVVRPLATRPLLLVTLSGARPLPLLTASDIASPAVEPSVSALIVAPPLPVARPAPLATVTPLVACVPPRRSVPPLTVVAPVYVCGLEKATAPAPDFTSEPLPLITPV